MAVTLISNPLGHKLANDVYSAEIVDSTGDALVMHSDTVVDGSWIYINSNIERYNGFKYVVTVSPTSFKIRNELGGDEILFIQVQDITFQISELEHTWQSVHLPIVYDLESNLFPENVPEESTTHKTISSFSNSNGYTQINTSAALSGPEELEFIEIVGTGSLAGKYQIISVVDADSIVIDLAYDAAYVFTGYYVLKYYSNYFVTVNVYAGLDPSHIWYDEKPFVLAATLRLIPDSNNRVKFSISEILKGFINTRNNLTLDTLPNNLDFYTQFYIDWFESYDEADGGEIVVFNGSVVEDSFRGNAVNSMMPFKSFYQSFMSDYLNSNGSRARWLTTQDVPVAVVGYYFDLSMLLPFDESVVSEGEGSVINVTIFKQYNGVVTSTEIIEMPAMGMGVIRVPFIPEAGYDRYCIKASLRGGDDISNLTLFYNSGTGTDWTLGADPYVNLDNVGAESSKIITLDRNYDVVGAEYHIILSVGFVSTGDPFIVQLGIYTSGMALIQEQSESFSGNGSGTIELVIIAPPTAEHIGIRVAKAPVSTVELEIHQLLITRLGTDIMETICVDIIDECGNTFRSDNLRITETDLFRELE